MNMWDGLFGGLTRTRDHFVGGLRKLLSGNQLDAETLEAMEELLYTADLGPAAGQLMEDLRVEHRRGSLSNADDVEIFVQKQLLDVIGEAPGDYQHDQHDGPFVVLVVGVNGSGKTTTIAKLGQRYKEAGQKVLLAACDTFRAAATEQLSIWAERLSLPLIKSEGGGDPSGLAYDAAQEAKNQGADVLLIDTAGRLHTADHLMAELEKITRVLGRCIEGAPHDVLLVIDGTTGQNAITQAREFQSRVAATSLAVTKLDGTARGGAIITIRQQLNLPVRFIGLGEQPQDLQPFAPHSFIEALFAE